MNVYLDSSAILRIVLGQPGFLQEWREWDLRITSDLSSVECLRTLDRLRIEKRLSDNALLDRHRDLFEVLETAERIPLTQTILQRASEPIPVVLGALDAIHLSTALSWWNLSGRELIMGTHDKSLARAARAFRMPVVGTD